MKNNSYVGNNGGVLNYLGNNDGGAFDQQKKSIQFNFQHKMIFKLIKNKMNKMNRNSNISIGPFANNGP